MANFDKEKIVEKLNELIKYIDNLIYIKDLIKEYEESIKSDILKKLSINPQKYQDNINNILSSEKQLEEAKEDAGKLLLSTKTTNFDEVNEQYKIFISNVLLNQLEGLVYISDYHKKAIKKYEIDILKNKGKVFPKEILDGIDVFLKAVDFYNNYLKKLMNIIYSIETFEKINKIENNIVMIGANGSGKSTFARSLQGKVEGNITIIPAQHLLVFENIRSIDVHEDMLENLKKYQKKDKLGSDIQIIQILSNDMQNLVKALFYEMDNCKTKYYDENIREECILNKTINLWNKLLGHRRIEKRDKYSLKVFDTENNMYEFNSLSDGEKAIFYYIAHVLLSEKDSYIIIDEPENHINLSICAELWNILEKERNDCRFIYLTHNIDFAISRINATIIWNIDFKAPAKWNFKILENNGELPEELVYKIVGSRKNILFCEGKDDMKLYQVLFPEFFVIPVGGHVNVINYCNTYNRRMELFKNKAIGIIDGDCHAKKQIEKWKSEQIYVLKINEIENLFFDPIIIQKVKERFYIEDEMIEEFKSILFKRYKSKKEEQATWFVNNIINNDFKNNMLKETKKIDDLINEVKTNFNEEKIKNIYNNRIELIDRIVEQEDYDLLIKHINFKNELFDLANNKIFNNYKERVLKLIQEDEELQEKIKNKYFSEISF